MALKYITLANTLRETIKKDEKKGRRLPTEMELMKEHQVSRQTVRQALDLLLAEGLIEKRQGSGTYIAQTSASVLIRSRNIAILTSGSEEHHSSLWNIQSLFSEAGYESQVFSTENRVGQERSILENLTEHPVKGILAEGTRSAFPNPNTDLYEKLQFLGTSILFVQSSYNALPHIPCVCSDDYDGGYMLARYLIAQGHKKIGGIFCGDDRRGHQRFYGCICALRDYHIPFDDRRFLWYDSRERTGPSEPVSSRRLLSFIQMQLSDCTAVICFNDEIACFLIRELLKLKIRVPDQISVAGFDNSHYNNISPVPITTASHRDLNLWMIGAQGLLKLIQHKPFTPEPLPWTLIRKESDRPEAYF